jgi:tripartite ATP-independent transporter DctM subunit
MTALALLLVAAVCAGLLLGYPVAFTLGGISLAFGLLGVALGAFPADDLAIIANRLYGTMTNETLVAVPLFVFMGVMLERARIAEQLLESMAALFGSLRGGLGISVVLVGGLLAASTGIVGATVVTMGLLSLPTMLRRGYDPALAAGTICASGTLGQVIPPSIILVLLGDVMSSAYQEAQNTLGRYGGETVSVGDLFAGALLPGLALVLLYIAYLSAMALWKPHKLPAIPAEDRAEIMKAGVLRTLIAGLLPAALLIFAVLGSILAGLATPTEAAAVGALGAMVLALLRRQFTLARLGEVTLGTAQVSSMVFMILLGASMFSLVFNAYGGDRLVQDLLHGLPGGAFGAMFAVMALMFLLGFIIDFIEIIFIVVPIVAPVLLAMGLDPIWLGVMMAVNLQTSFLTPPFGFALFYLRGVAPPELRTGQIYRGVAPFIALQVLMLGLLAFWPALATWLPKLVYAP